MGGNGQGKTTLLKLINGDEKLTGGKIDLAPGCDIGYFHQDHATLDFNLNPVEQIQKLRPDFQYGDIRASLGRFQFSSEQVATKLSNCPAASEPAALLKLLLEENNLLLMDEPTNHPDMESKATLEEALDELRGSLITVSHDRWFLDQVVNRILELQDGGHRLLRQLHRLRACQKGPATPRRRRSLRSRRSSMDLVHASRGFVHTNAK